MKFKESRLATAIVLVPILYLLIRGLPPVFFFIFAAAVIMRVQYEFYDLFYRNRGRRSVYVGLALGLSLSIRFYLEKSGGVRNPIPFEMVFPLLLMAVFLYHLFFFQDIKTTLVDSSVLFLGVVYIAGFLSYLIWIRLSTDGSALIIFLLFLIWGGDAGAYYAGRSIGRRKLYPQVSPNKTVEGAFGGLVGSFIGGFLAKMIFGLSFFSFFDLVFLAILLGGFGQLGDLTESMLKRSAGVKDSSALIPAHGGLLDKLDSVAFAAPLFYYYLFWMKGYGRFTIGF